MTKPRHDNDLPNGALAFLLVVALFLVGLSVSVYDTGPIRQYHGSARGALLALISEGLLGPNGVSYVCGAIGVGLAGLVLWVWRNQRRPPS